MKSRHSCVNDSGWNRRYSHCRVMYETSYNYLGICKKKFSYFEKFTNVHLVSLFPENRKYSFSDENILDKTGTLLIVTLRDYSAYDMSSNSGRWRKAQSLASLAGVAGAVNSTIRLLQSQYCDTSHKNRWSMQWVRLRTAGKEHSPNRHSRFLWPTTLPVTLSCSSQRMLYLSKAKSRMFLLAVLQPVLNFAQSTSWNDYYIAICITKDQVQLVTQTGFTKMGKTLSFSLMYPA